MLSRIPFSSGGVEKMKMWENSEKPNRLKKKSLISSGTECIIRTCFSSALTGGVTFAAPSRAPKMRHYSHSIQFRTERIQIIGKMWTENNNNCFRQQKPHSLRVCSVGITSGERTDA